MGTYLSIPKVNPKNFDRHSTRGKTLVKVNQVRMNFKLPFQEIKEKLANA